MIRVFIFLALDSGEGHAVVGGYDYERVFEFAFFFEGLHHFLQVLVEVFDLKGVIE